MELKEFIKATLEQILGGVAAAQNLDNGEQINARAALKDPGGALINGGGYGMFTRVDFDVAVSGQTTGKGGVNLKVFSIGVEGGGEHKTEVANRIKFSIPVRLPDGDVEVAKNVEAARVARNNQRIETNKKRASGFRS